MNDVSDLCPVADRVVALLMFSAWLIGLGIGGVLGMWLKR